MSIQEVTATSAARSTSAATPTWKSTARNYAEDAREIGRTMTTGGALSLAPHVGLNSMDDGMFAGHAGPAVIDQLRFMHELGFRAFEDNFMKLRPIEEQKAIAREMERLDMRLATFVASFETTGPKGSTLPLDSLTFASGNRDDRSALLRMIEASGEVAKRMNARRSTVLSGRIIESMSWEYQTANVIENLKYAADIAEAYGFILGLEPINSREWTGTLVTTAPHAHLIVQAVDHPNVRMIYDTYHAQIETGSMIENLDQAWDSIDYIQIADAPGRCEPGTGEMNYSRILRYLYDKGYRNDVGVEHGNSVPGIAGEIKTILALREVMPRASSATDQ